jgi:hypothetical protein
MRPMDKGRAVPFLSSPSIKGTELQWWLPFQKGAALGRGNVLPTAFLLCHTCVSMSRRKERK